MTTCGKREATFRSQEHRCFYCGTLTEWNKWTRDHKIPWSRGGRGNRNYVGACYACNHAKGNMSMEEFLDTDYLSPERRQSFGAIKPPNHKYRFAKKNHSKRLSTNGSIRHSFPPSDIPVHVVGDFRKDSSKP